MKFFQGIQIVDKEKNIDCELLNLGRINVLCGKNNAGKTTLLKLIESRKYTQKTVLSSKEIIQMESYIKKITQEDFTQIFTEEYTEENLMTDINLHVDNFFLELKSDSFIKENIKSYNIKDLAKIIVDIRIRDINSIFNKIHFTNNILTLLLFRGNIKYVEAKRRINIENNSNISLSSNEKISTYLERDMREVIKYLYQCQNARKVSKEFSYYNTIKQGFKKISKGYSFDIVLDRDTTYLEFAYKDKPSISAEDMGLGLRDVLTILIYAVFPDYNIVLIEEPENHLHPEMQRDLLRFLSQQTDKQFFISTHSSVFLDMSYVDKIYTVFYDDKINVRESTDKADALSELGYLSSDNLLSDVVILTEGITDAPVLEEFLRIYNLFEEYDIKFLWLGGIDNLVTTNYDALRENYKKVFVVTDGDKGSKEKVEKINNIISKIDNVIHCQLEGYGIESYLNSKVVQKHYDESQATLENKFSSSLKEGSELFPLDKPVELFGRKGKFESHYRTIASKMTETDIKNAYDICENFIAKVKEVCEPLLMKN